jgi:hypothetical protein
LSQALQSRLRRGGAIVELTVDKSSVVEHSLDSNDMRTEDEESPLLRNHCQETAGEDSRCCGEL